MFTNILSNRSKVVNNKGTVIYKYISYILFKRVIFLFVYLTVYLNLYVVSLTVKQTLWLLLHVWKSLLPSRLQNGGKRNKMHIFTECKEIVLWINLLGTSGSENGFTEDVFKFLKFFPMKKDENDDLYTRIIKNQNVWLIILDKNICNKIKSFLCVRRCWKDLTWILLYEDEILMHTRRVHQSFAAWTARWPDAAHHPSNWFRIQCYPVSRLGATQG